MEKRGCWELLGGICFVNVMRDMKACLGQHMICSFHLTRAIRTCLGQPLQHVRAPRPSDRVLPLVWRKCGNPMWQGFGLRLTHPDPQRHLPRPHTPSLLLLPQITLAIEAAALALQVQLDH